MTATRTWAVTCLLLCGGCASGPFNPVATVPLTGSDGMALYDAVRASSPVRFTILSSVVFAYRGRSTSVLGCTEVDTAEGTFSVVAMAPTGMKAFELRGSESGVEPVFVAPQLTERADPVEAIGADIRRVYLDGLPPRSASRVMKDDRVVFTCDTEGGRLEYVLGGTPPVLIEKKQTDGDGTVWRVTYHEYVEREGMRFPGGVVLKHHRYGYRLIIRLKEILEMSGAGAEKGTGG
jgi:hypothetical protein